MSTFNGSRDLRWLIWAGPAVFLIHDLEELATIENWTRVHGLRIPEIARSLLPVETVEFGASLSLLLVVVIGASWLTARYGSSSRWFDFFLLVVAVLGINGAGHVLQSAVFGGYVPGLFTGLVLSLPYSLWVFTRTYRLQLRSGWWCGAIVGLAILVHAPTALLALIFGKAIV